MGKRIKIIFDDGRLYCYVLLDEHQIELLERDGKLEYAADDVYSATNAVEYSNLRAWSLSQTTAQSDTKATP